jgi:hypothetical protein
MIELAIGVWVRRRGGKFHLVESVVADRAVTRCGHEMHRLTGGGELEVSRVMPLTWMIGQPQLCKAGCDRETPA